MQNCYNVGKGSQDNQNERLTNKHIKTLSFLQEIAEENKQLKAKIKEYEIQCLECGDLHDIAKNAKQRIAEIQEQYLKRADEINAMLLEKHKIELMRAFEEKMSAEKQWQDEKRKLLDELEAQKRSRQDLDEQFDSCQDHVQQIKILELKVDALQQEIDRLNEKSSAQEEANQNQLAELRRLQHVDNKGSSLSDEIRALQQHNQQLELKLERLKEHNPSASSPDQAELLESLRAKLSKLLSDKSAWETRERDYLLNMDEMRSESSKVKRALTDSELARGEMHQQLDEVLMELAKLKKQLAARDREKENFKDFIQMKRELILLQEENDMLRTRTKKVSGGKRQKSVGHLPSLTYEGNTTYKRLDSASKDRVKVAPSYAMLTG